MNIEPKPLNEQTKVQLILTAAALRQQLARLRERQTELTNSLDFLLKERKQSKKKAKFLSKTIKRLTTYSTLTH